MMASKEIYKAIYDDTLKRYQCRFNKLGETPKALGWGGREDQIERFETMYKHYDFNGKVIMDIGCGFADLYSFLVSRGVESEYVGIDIVPEFIECCVKKFPEATFINANIMLESNKLPKADVVVTNGTLNFKQCIIDNMVYTEDFINIAYKKAGHALIVDFLSTQLTPDYPKEEQVFYHNPKEILDVAFKYTNNLELIHNYKAIPQKEFMLFMYKS